MRTEDEIQEAHDLLVGLVLGEARLQEGWTPESKAAVHSAADVLCWVLKHDHNRTFEGNLEKLRKAAEAVMCWEEQLMPFIVKRLLDDAAGRHRFWLGHEGWLQNEQLATRFKSNVEAKDAIKRAEKVVGARYWIFQVVS